MPSQEPGFLPAVQDAERNLIPQPPKGRPTRPQKARATDMDESLMTIQQMKEHVEAINARQAEAAKRMKEGKSTVVKLRQEVANVQNQLHTMSSSKDDTEKTTQEIASHMERIQVEHNSLHVVHSKTKSSLDSALAAQEEYRKGCNSLRAALNKATEDMGKKEQELESIKGAQDELLRVRGTREEREAKFEEDLRDSKETLSRIMNRQKAKSKAVLDRMLAGQSETLKTMVYQAWVKIGQETKAQKENEQLLAQAQGRLKDFQAKKKDEAKSVLDRMTTANNTGLVGTVFTSWSTEYQEQKKAKEESAALQETLRKQKSDAQNTLKRNLGSSMLGAMGSAFQAWTNYFNEWKKEKGMREQADKLMKDYKSAKKGQASSVVDRMSGQKTTALLAQVLMGWRLMTAEEKRARVMHADLYAKIVSLETDTSKLKEIVAKKNEILDDHNEELAECRKKNQALKQEFQEIVKLTETMDASMEDMDAED